MPELTGAAVELAAWAVHAPGRAAADLPGSPEEPACTADDAKTVLGRRGLLGKEPATRLALCAVHRALGLPPGPALPVPGADGTAVVVASNLGNVGTVCSLLDTMRGRGAAAVSPLDAPNASSNVIASSVAIRFGFTGPNLTVCSGATAGLDALRLATLLVRAGRAVRAVVVGVEPGDAIAARIAALGPDAEPLLEVAACLLVGRPGAWPSRTPLTLGPVERTPAEAILPGCYGAAGVVGVAVAAQDLAAHGGSARVGCGDPVDGWRSVALAAGHRAAA